MRSFAAEHVGGAPTLELLRSRLGSAVHASLPQLAMACAALGAAVWPQQQAIAAVEL